LWVPWLQSFFIDGKAVGIIIKSCLSVSRLIRNGVFISRFQTSYLDAFLNSSRRRTRDRVQIFSLAWIASGRSSSSIRCHGQSTVGQSQSLDHGPPLTNPLLRRPLDHLSTCPLQFSRHFIWVMDSHLARCSPLKCLVSTGFSTFTCNWHWPG